MKVYCIICNWLIVTAVAAFGQSNNRAIDQLNEVLEHKSEYSRQKELRIAALKRRKPADGFTLEACLKNQALGREYQKYRIDSAVFYVARSIRIAEVLKNDSLATVARLDLANLYSSLGKFLEAETILKSVKMKTLDKARRIAYYSASIQFLEHYSTNSYSEEHVKAIAGYRDSLLTLLDPRSVSYQINLAQKEIGNGALKAAQRRLSAMVGGLKGAPADYAMVTYLLGYSYHLQNNREATISYYALSAATDVRSAIKDHASLQNLALLFYGSGDLEKAYKYTRSAIEDAIFCNVKFRTLRMSELYTIINAAYLTKEAEQKDRLKLYLLLISVLSAFLTVAVIYVYKQMKKVSRIKEELALNSAGMAALNREISKNNRRLNEINGQLSEANQVKEVYIAQFFNLCSTYINKLEEYRKTLNREAGARRFDELMRMLRSTTMIKKEAEELYRIFDNIFLSLYPDFIDQFNALLVPAERIVLKPGELLNTELRIYALIRLGITDSVKIAAFLRYSLSTIYNYRTNARNKSAVPRDEFEEMVSKIGSASGERS